MTTNTFPAHHHSSSCWWDHTQARWSCETSGLGPRVDVRDMIVVHTAMLREFRLAPTAVTRVAADDRARARSVDRHLGLLCGLLHHHHAGEDELLWPVLRGRLAPAEAALLDVAEAQHAGIEEALARVGAARAEWVDSPDRECSERLVDALGLLHRLLAEHLDAEERHLLPLAAAHLEEPEWRAVGEAGAASVPKELLPLVFGMFAYEGDPAVLATMLGDAPLLPRVLVPRVAPRIYARRAKALYGTATP